MSVVPTADHGVQVPAGARSLGVRVKPILRLGMGRRVERRRKDGSTFMVPEKTDHFTVRGDARAVAKFRETYGEQPKALRLMLPAAIDQALTIQYRAFKGGQSEDGGSLVAVGHTNYALREWCGGPDVLTVWNQDGTVAQVETAGLDAITREPLDEIARDLGLELYTTLRAGMPDVLGFGSFFDLSTKGKESTDNLWSKLRDIYAIFGSRASIAVAPMLVIRPSTARPVVVKDGEPRRIKTTIYVADVVIPETIEEALDRLRERQEILAPAGAAAAIYGPQVPQLGPGDVDPDDDYETVTDVEIIDTEDILPVDDGQQAPADTPLSAGVPGHDDEPQVGGPVEAEAFPIPAGVQEQLAPPSLEEIQAALAAVVPKGTMEGKTLGHIVGTVGGPDWLSWALDRAPSYWSKGFRRQLELVASLQEEGS